MSGKPAARVGDMHTCPTVDPGPKPHVGGPVLPAGEPTVLIGGMPAARVGDKATCVGPPDTIAAGAFPVPIGKTPAARMTDQTAHGGVVVGGCATVLIGLSGTTGNPRVGTGACQTAAAGRSSGTTSQSYNNCGVESSRQVINQATSANLTENGLLQSAINNGNAGGSPGTPLQVANGGTVPAGQVNILSNNGVPASVIPATPTGAQLSQYELALSQGRGVLAGGDVSGLPGWGSQSGGHSVLLTGFEYDDNGNITHVLYTDTGIGVCNQRATAAQFQNAMNIEANNIIANGGTPLGAAVTNNPIW